MRNHKPMTQLPGEPENAVKCRCHQNCTLDDISNTLQDIRKRTNIGKFAPYKSSGFREKQPLRVEFKDKPKERVEEAKKKVYAIEKLPDEESPTEDSESDSMGDAIREQSDNDQDPREEFLVEYQEEAPLEIQDIQLEEGMPQDTSNKNLCKHTQDAQTFLVIPTKGIAYIHGTATKVTVCMDNSQHPLITESGAHFSIVARQYLDNHFPNWEEQLLPTKAKNFKSASGNMTSIGTIIKEIIIPNGKGNIRLNPEFVVRENSHIEGFLLGTDYQMMYGIDIYNSKNRHITIGTNKEKKFSLDIYQISSQDPLEELMNELREGSFSTTLTNKQKLSLLKMLRKNREAFAIGEEPLGKIKGHDIELCLDVERPYPPMLRRPPHPASLETRKEIEKHINELLDMDFIRKIGHNEIVEITTPVLITWHDGKSQMCGDFRALNNYTKADRYPIPRIPQALDKLAKAKYIAKMDCMKGFYQNGVNPSSMKLLRTICHMGIYEYTGMSFGIKNAPAHFQRMIDTSFQEEILEGWMVVYIDDIIIYSETWEDHVQYIARVLNAEFSQGLGAALHQRQIVDGEPREGVIFYISRKLKDSEARYGATHTECLCLVCDLEKLHYYLEGAVFEVYTDCTALKSLLNMKTTNRNMLRWQIAIQEYRRNMTIIYKEGKSHTNADGLSRWPLDNVKSNPAHDPEVAAKVPVHFMEIDRRRNFSFCELAPGSGTLDSGNNDSGGTETPILVISSSERQNEFFSAVLKSYAKNKHCGILLQLLHVDGRL
ncbi:hypothetical protein O181_080779 [Austropuccinia psidii MF-1]|uniref:Reverse transcriptase domain-containing protein n=1 Tax=Austropuccinia psidii MF-1 TaxID=1389203 RepID=A0A9Q3FL33_9BASI|nr:hypothetical protein [Austropuccinia psidii MF-1]